MNGSAVATAVNICADAVVQRSFTRPAPHVNGRPCLPVAPAVEKGATYSARCRIEDELYRVGSASHGDLTRDFTVEMTVTRQDRKGPMLEQVRRYRRLEACPVGWKIGDSAASGEKKVVNTLTGEVRYVENAAG